MFKKEDLKNGMRIKTRDGEIMMFMDGIFYGLGDMYNYKPLNNYTNYPNLYGYRKSDCDIIAIYDIPYCEGNLLRTGEMGKLLWEYEEKDTDIKKEIADIKEQQRKLADRLEEIEKEC